MEILYNPRKTRLIEMRKKGMSLESMAYEFGVTRQAISQCLGNVGRIQLYPEGYRKCCVCKSIKADNEFYNNSGKGGKSRCCIDCTKEKSRQSMKKNKKMFLKGGKYYEHQKCRLKTHFLIKKGVIKKTGCKLEDETCQGRIEAHHYAGYDHPELVDFYCSKHHHQVEGMAWGKRKTIDKLEYMV